MKKILLLFFVSFIIGSTSLFADDFSDCFDIERLKAKREGASSHEAIKEAELICIVKKKNNTSNKVTENSLEDSTQRSLSKSLNLVTEFFVGEKTFRGIEDLKLPMVGFLVDFYLNSRFSFTAGYLQSTGKVENIQLPYSTRETYHDPSLDTPPRKDSPVGGYFYCSFFDDSDCFDWMQVESKSSCFFSGDRDIMSQYDGSIYCAWSDYDSPALKPATYQSECVDPEGVDCYQWKHTKNITRIITSKFLSRKIRNSEFSFGGRFYLVKRNPTQKDLDLFLGVGLVSINTEAEFSFGSVQNSGSGAYIEFGVKYIFQSGLNIGYYLRQSSATFALANATKSDWGGTTNGLQLVFAF